MLHPFRETTFIKRATQAPQRAWDRATRTSSVSVVGTTQFLTLTIEMGWQSVLVKNAKFLIMDYDWPTKNLLLFRHLGIPSPTRALLTKYADQAEMDAADMRARPRW